MSDTVTEEMEDETMDNADQEDDEALEEAIIREIKRRRRETKMMEAPEVTLKERRALDQANVTKLLKENDNLLASWTDILAPCLEGRDPKPFLMLKNVDDFTDGFELRVLEGIKPQ